MSTEQHQMDLMDGQKAECYMEKVNQHDYEDKQGVGGIMFWACIVRGQSIGPLNLTDGDKMNAENYCKFLGDNNIS